MARYLRIGISRLNEAIADYSLARLELILLHPDAPQPPVFQRVGGQVSDEPQFRRWADIMKRVAALRNYLDRVRADNAALYREPAFERLMRAAKVVAVDAWDLEKIRRLGGSKS